MPAFFLSRSVGPFLSGLRVTAVALLLALSCAELSANDTESLVRFGPRQLHARKRPVAAEPAQAPVSVVRQAPVAMPAPAPMPAPVVLAPSVVETPPALAVPAPARPVPAPALDPAELEPLDPSALEPLDPSQLEPRPAPAAP